MARSWRGEKEPGLLSTQGSHPVPGPASRLQMLLGFLRVLERQELLSPPSREGPLSGHVHPGLGLGGWGRSRSLPWGPEGQGLIRLRPAHPGPRRRPGRTPGRKGAGGSPEDAGRSVGGAPRGPRPGGRADARECPAATRAEARRRGRWRLPRPLRFSLLLSTVNEGWFLITGEKTNLQKRDGTRRAPGKGATPPPVGRERPGLRGLKPTRLGRAPSVTCPSPQAPAVRWGHRRDLQVTERAPSPRT